MDVGNSNECLLSAGWGDLFAIYIFNRGRWRKKAFAHLHFNNLPPGGISLCNLLRQSINFYLWRGLLWINLLNDSQEIFAAAKIFSSFQPANKLHETKVASPRQTINVSQKPGPPPPPPSRRRPSQFVTFEASVQYNAHMPHAVQVLTKLSAHYRLSGLLALCQPTLHSWVNPRASMWEAGLILATTTQRVR